VALVGSRTLLDLACAVGTGLGVYVLVLPRPPATRGGAGPVALSAAFCVFTVD
jgi:hypothetical protein